MLTLLVVAVILAVIVFAVARVYTQAAAPRQPSGDRPQAGVTDTDVKPPAPGSPGARAGDPPLPGSRASRRLHDKP